MRNGLATAKKCDKGIALSAVYSPKFWDVAGYSNKIPFGINSNFSDPDTLKTGFLHYTNKGHSGVAIKFGNKVKITVFSDASFQYGLNATSSSEAITAKLINGYYTAMIDIAENDKLSILRSVSFESGHQNFVFLFA